MVEGWVVQGERLVCVYVCIGFYPGHPQAVRVVRLRMRVFDVPKGGIMKKMCGHAL
jgi:hypothetical protein